MKKILSVLLATILLLTAITTTVFAAPSVDIDIPAPAITATADTTSVIDGDIVTITVKVPADSNLIDLSYVIRYNTSYFQLMEGSATLNGVFSSEMSNDQIAGEFKYSGTSGTPITDEEVLFTIQFAILQTGGRLTFEVDKARISSNGRILNVTATSLLASTKVITFKAATEASRNYFDITTPSTTTIKYNDGIVLHVTAKRLLPLGSYFRWSANNDNFKMTPSELGTSCEIISAKNGPTEITVELVSALGEVIDSETITITSKAGLFDIIAGFFRSLFGKTEILPF